MPLHAVLKHILFNINMYTLLNQIILKIVQKFCSFYHEQYDKRQARSIFIV